MQAEDNEDSRECSGDVKELDSPTSSSPADGRRQAPPKRNRNIFWVILKGIILAFIIFSFFLLLGIAAVVLFHFGVARGPPYNPPQPHRSPSSSSSEFESDSPAYTADELQTFLPSFEYSDDGSMSVKDCAICLDCFHGGERIRKLPNCNHTFHSNCVEKWLMRVSNCPICRLWLNFMPDDS